MEKTFKVEIEVDAVYDLTPYQYGADADGKNGVTRYDVNVRRILTQVGDILGQIERKIIEEVVNE